MASLPSNTFLFNYNAKRYSSGVFAKEPGQLYDYDLQLGNPAAVTVYGDYVQFNSYSYQVRQYTDAAVNPFNRSSADSTFTFIYKTSGYSEQGDRKLFSNRQVGSTAGQSKNDCHNYLIASNSVFGFDGSFNPSNNPQYIVIRAFSDNSGLRQEVDVNGNVIQSAVTASVGWDSPSAGIGFFTGGYGYTGNRECFLNNFYWMYCSNEALTDAEVLQVIKYNENSGSTFEVDTTAITATYSATTSSVTLTADEDMAWTASTLNDWITLSTTGGTGSSVFTVSLSKNTAYTQRVGTVSLTNGEDVIEIVCTQEKYPLLVPKNNIYRGGTLVN